MNSNIFMDNSKIRPCDKRSNCVKNKFLLQLLSNCVKTYHFKQIMCHLSQKYSLLTLQFSQKHFYQGRK